MISVNWNPAEGILSTRVKGILSRGDAEHWQETLHATASTIAPDRTFKVLIDIRGYEVSEQLPEVHKIMREVTPLFLTTHGFNVAFYQFLEVEPPDIHDSSKAICGAVAHVHHDLAKITRYKESLAGPSENFFNDIHEAWHWLRQVW